MVMRRGLIHISRVDFLPVLRQELPMLLALSLSFEDGD